MGINLEVQKKIMKDHVATFTDYGNIKMLDFKNPESNHYRIRFLFEEDYYRLHITGDLGSLVATNYYNMTYEGFGDFVNNTGYFEGKIDCHERPIYFYDDDEARKDLLDLIKEHELEEDILYNFDCIDDFIDAVMEDYGKNGIGSKGYEELEEVVDNAWECGAYDLGKRESGILDLYMLAFRLAKEQLDTEVEK